MRYVLFDNRFFLLWLSSRDKGLCNAYHYDHEMYIYFVRAQIMHWLCFFMERNFNSNDFLTIKIKLILNLRFLLKISKPYQFRTSYFQNKIKGNCSYNENLFHSL